jgi:hypothetical protein
MPFVLSWVPPAIAVVHDGVTVFHTYGDDLASSGPDPYRFTLDPSNPADGVDVFDIRDLTSGLNAATTQGVVAGETKAVAEALRSAIATGTITGRQEPSMLADPSSAPQLVVGELLSTLAALPAQQALVVRRLVRVIATDVVEATRAGIGGSYDDAPWPEVWAYMHHNYGAL